MIVKFDIDDFYPCYLETESKELFSVEMSEQELKEYKKAMKNFFKVQQMVKDKAKPKETIDG